VNISDALDLLKVRLLGCRSHHCRKVPGLSHGSVEFACSPCFGVGFFWFLSQSKEWSIWLTKTRVSQTGGPWSCSVPDQTHLSKLIKVFRITRNSQVMCLIRVGAKLCGTAALQNPAVDHSKLTIGMCISVFATVQVVPTPSAQDATPLRRIGRVTDCIMDLFFSSSEFLANCMQVCKNRFGTKLWRTVAE